MYRGDDIYFHLNRIEGLYLGIKNGDVFPKINSFFLYGMGYAAPVFYSDIFLYPAAILRLLGLSVANSYTVFLIGINFVTYVIAYHSFLVYKKVPFQAFLFAILYGTSSYRLSDLTERAAVGEVLAFAFIPLAFVGLWSILQGESNRFYLLSLGMSGLILSHVLSAFIFSLFIFVYVLLGIRHFISHKERIVAFFKAVFLTVLLCVGFLGPIGEQIVNQSFNFQTNQVAQLSQEAESLIAYLQIAFRNSGYNNLGLLIIGLMVLLLLSYNKISVQSKRLLLTTSLFLLISTSFFPHRLLEKTLVNAIQFPWRLFLIVTFGVCWLFADNYSLLAEKKRNWSKLCAYGSMVIAVMLVFTHSLFMTDLERFVPRSEIEQLQPAFLGWGNEYVPSNTDLFSLIQEPKMIRNSKGVTLEHVSFDYGAIELDYETKENDSKETIVFPLIYYKGYQAVANGKRIDVYNSSTFPGLSEIRVSGNGTLRVSYHWTVVQLFSASVSVGTWLILLVWQYTKFKNEKK
ncbi:hypothetical protein [Enterococcus termitis]|uniref:Membrane protein 6-pyruvoyl-tetrahydropterin synthase-related domain-containing protein n=1 Tax=Enterococcus termitis TaxID=332950 RepID=A0A1E5GJK9_9ENTE|nr:hypothetical protein [Enterococcus termitis]OEG12430.1 hypothetical protein BCR25_07780 [Enterococcus termitis]OJG98737.1 hypothetical protein RV18_GL002599 [Enterococcus termitis]